ncbi:MAG: helix-turn-helix transcriptional regulator [Clostridia bacterium]|nr:helix-turn-helix transcriptional regulator [Clostridia bacterium]
MSDLKATIARNLTELRTQAHLTQLQLAEMLNYSDKAVSKWERGEAIPDLRVLIRLTEIYGVTLDEIVKEEAPVPRVQPKKHINVTRAFIVAMSAVLVWFIASWIFMIFFFIAPTAHDAYFVFVVAPLPTAIVLTVFSGIWGTRLTSAISSSFIVMSCALIIHMFVWRFAPEFKQIFIIWVVAAIFEILIILWFSYRRILKLGWVVKITDKTKKNKNKSE